MRSEQLRKGGARRRGQMPSFARPAGELVNFGRTASAAGDQEKVCSHTTHNFCSTFVLSFVSQDPESILRLAAALKIKLFQELAYLAYHVLRGPFRNPEGHVMAIELDLLVPFVIESTSSTWCN